MKPKKFFQATVCAFSSAGLLMPQSQLLAATPDAPPAQIQPAAPMVLDVALAEGGLLRGQVVDGAGQPVAEAPVAVFYEGKEVAKTTSDADGNFAISSLKGGQHVVISGDHGGLCRMWSTQTAPPSANSRMLIVKSPQLVRGQWLSGGGLLMLGVLGGIVAGGVISQGSSDDNNHSGS
jgi:hypothetical protein